MARIALSVAAVAAVASSASADGMLPGGAEVSVDSIRIFEGGIYKIPSDNEAGARYFNFAHCICSDLDLGLETQYQLEVRAINHTTPINRPLEFWLGTACNDPVQRPTTCVLKAAATIADIDTIAIAPAYPQFGIAETLDPLSPTDCPDAEGQATIWMMVDTDGDATYDYDTNVAVGYDTQAPPGPANAAADPGEAAVVVSWDAPTSGAEDVQYYQALCARADTGAPAFGVAPVLPRYQTSVELCGATSGRVVLQAVSVSAKAVPGPLIDAAVPDAAPPPDAMPTANVPAGIVDLDPAFICGETGPGATEIRIDGLQNETDYFVAVIAVDFVGNAAGIYFTTPLRPRPVTDFWEDLHDSGSDVEGGFCLVATTFGDGSPLTSALRAFRDDTLAKTAGGRALIRAFYAVSGAIAPAITGSIAGRILAGVVLAPLIIIALVWHVIGLPGLLALVVAAWWWRRRRRAGPRRARPGLRHARAATAAAIVVALGTTASAQPSNDPYWSDPFVADAADSGVAEPRWHVGLRAGPYTPRIDAQVGADPGPYERMFGGDAIMPVLDVDWIFLRRFGQLGVGGSIGILWKTANALEPGFDPSDPDPPRSEGDQTTFRLLPLAVTLVYRLTHLDDAYGIPVVPYVRGGLSYYIWWSRAPNGRTAVVLDPPGCSPSAADCTVNRARGATLGVQGSIGLAIRAERIDPAAARSMREGGVEHAGFYAELQLAKVDGFGSDSKLSVGDTTWFAGVNFEF